MNSQATWTDIVFGLVIAGFMGWGAYANFIGGTLWLAALLGLAALFFAGFVGVSLRRGLRPQTHLERYESWALLRLVMVGGGGLAGLWGGMVVLSPLSQGWPRWARAAIVLAWLLVWIIAIIISASKVRMRHETASAYKRRIGFRE